MVPFTSAAEAVRLFLTIKLSAEDAVKALVEFIVDDAVNAYDAEVALLAVLESIAELAVNA
jgi:hypothetical protein